MRFKSHLESDRGLKQIIVVPLIGVVLLLLIFFLLISNFVSPQGINVNLPKALTSEAVGQRNPEIVISEKNEVLLDGKVITLGNLKNLLAQFSRNNIPVILIKADKSALLGKVIEVWNTCKDAGVKQLNLLTK